MSSLWGSLMTTFFQGGILSTNRHVFTNKSNGRVRRQNVSSELCTISRSTVSLEQLERKISAHHRRILDKELSPRLQLMADLRQTIQTVRQSEKISAQLSLQGDAAGSVQEVQFKRKSTNWKPQQRQQGKSKERGGEKKCSKCGKMQHNRDEKCPAERATCHNCHRMGHWARVCRSRSVNEATKNTGPT